MARKRRFRFGLPIVFAGPVCRRARPWLSANSVHCGGQVRRARQCIAWQRIVWFKKPAADFPERA